MISPVTSKGGHQVLDYTELKDEGGLEAWPGFDELPYAKTVEGDPVQSGRFDSGGLGMRTMTGVWACTEGSFEYTYPGDEICTLLEGRIRLVSADGESHEFTAGDTFYNSKGEVWNWTVIEPVRKIFHIHDPDSDDLAD